MTRTREFLAEPLNRTSIPIMAATVLTAGLGVLFWALATRLFGPAEVGRDGALITAMIAIATMCDLSMNNLLLRFLPQLRGHHVRRVLTAYAIAAGAALIGALAFVIIAPKVSSQYDFLATDSQLRALFLVSVIFWAVFVSQDAVLAGAGAASWLPTENGGFGVLKIIAIVVASAMSAQFGIFIGWVLPLFIVVPVVNWLIFSRVIPRLRERPVKGPEILEQAGGRRALFAFVRRDIVSTVINQSGTVALPIIVVGIIGATAGAYFVVPFALVSAFDALYVGVVIAVTTESARDLSRVPEVVGGAWKRLKGFTAPCALLVAVAAPLFLIPNGRDYMENAAWPLRFLALASIPHAVVMLYSAILRVQTRGGKLMVLQVVNVTLILTAVALLASAHGATGAAAGWLIGMGLTAVICIWPLMRFLRDPHVIEPPTATDLLAEGEEALIREVG